MTDNTSPASSSLAGLQRVPLLLVAVLALCSLGFYVPYWLYTRSRALNAMDPSRAIPVWFMALCMGGFLMLLGLIMQFPPGMTAEEWMASKEFQPVMQVAIAVNVLMLAWSMIFLHRLNRITGVGYGDPRYGSYFFLVLVHLMIVSIFYLQYKINQHLDQRQTGSVIL